MTLSSPLRVTWDLTTKCNLFCRHCYNTSRLRGERSPPNSLHTIAEKLADTGIFLVTLSGGEPLMEPEIWTLIQMFNDKKKPVELATNGTLITEKVARKIKKFNINSVQISIDGLRETHDYQRGVKGCFDKSMKGAEYVLKEDIPVIVSTVVWQENVEEVQPLLEVLLQIGVQGFRATRLISMGRGKTSKLEPLTKNQIKSLTLHMLEQREKLQGQIQILLDECISFLGEEIHEYGLSWSGCPAGRTECAVDFKGNVYPCVFLTYDEFCIGNLLESSFDEIWHSENFEKFRKIERVCNCEIADFCKGGCPAAAYGMYGDITRKDPYCWRNNHE